MLSAPDQEPTYGGGSTLDYVAPIGEPTTGKPVAPQYSALAAEPTSTTTVNMPAQAAGSPAAGPAGMIDKAKSGLVAAGAAVSAKANGFWAWLKGLFGGADTSGAKVAGTSDGVSWMVWVLVAGVAAALYFAATGKKGKGKSIFGKLGGKSSFKL